MSAFKLLSVSLHAAAKSNILGVRSLSKWSSWKLAHKAGGVAVVQQVRSIHVTAPSKRGEPLQSPTVPDTAEDCRVIVVTSGKGGVGKTTTSASFAFGLANKGLKVCAIDFDIGLRNLDLHLGMERRVVYDFVNVIQEECTLRQALIKDKRCSNLYMLAASQTRDKTALNQDGVAAVISELKKDFDVIVCDSPAGIEHGAFQAMYFADEAVMCTNPELSSVRDTDKMLGIIASKSQRAVSGLEPVTPYLLVTRFDPKLYQEDTMLGVYDIEEMLGIPLLGVIPESQDVLKSSNVGQPVILSEGNAGAAYSDLVDRFMGEKREMRFLEPENEGFFKRLFNK